MVDCLGEEAAIRDLTDEQGKILEPLIWELPRRTDRRGRPWEVERPFAWLGDLRRRVVHHERHALNYLDFVLLGCILILLQRSS